jgi:glycosyltransferase involved in cell wall biosynthesis
MIDDARPSSSPSHVVLDLSRLIYAARSRTPTGIPRVELAYAQHFIATHSDHLSFAVLDALGRLGVVNNADAIAFVNQIGRYWQTDVASTWTYACVVIRAIRIHVALLFRLRGNLARLVSQRSGHTTYIITSQLDLKYTKTIRKKAAGHLSLVYFVHDIIPSLFPEYLMPIEESRNRRRMASAARLADVIITNSKNTADSFRKMFGRERTPGSIAIAPLGLGIDLRAVVPTWTPAYTCAKPYFVMVGTIEPRKNHLLILHLWRALRADLGDATPRLIVVGARGWENENVIDLLERCPALKGVVEERSRVSDAELVGILKGARALLLPSFAEGYGMPLSESLALGVPVLCSDIPTFREVGGMVPEFFDPLDGPAWRTAVIDYLLDGSPRRKAQFQRLATWRHATWVDHFQHIDDLLKEIDRQKGASPRNVST